MHTHSTAKLIDELDAYLQIWYMGASCPVDSVVLWWSLLIRTKISNLEDVHMWNILAVCLLPEGL